MAERLVTTGPGPSAAVGEGHVAVSASEVLRDIARGGIASIIVGLFVAGLGGRLVMRIATIRHEDTVGMFTENGELIGRISLEGTIALMVFGGLGMGLLAGTIWVIASPWMPGRGWPRALETAAAAIALGMPPLIQRTNSDFIILDHDPVVIALLIALVGLVGLSIALLDDVLDARLPRPPRAIAASTAAYLLVTLAGLVLILPIVMAMLLTGSEYQATIRAGWALVVVGVSTLTWWALRVTGRATPPTALRLAASVALVIAVVLGLATGVPAALAEAGIRS